jgi:hypothetical protein
MRSSLFVKSFCGIIGSNLREEPTMAVDPNPSNPHVHHATTAEARRACNDPVGDLVCAVFPAAMSSRHLPPITVDTAEPYMAIADDGTMLSITGGRVVATYRDGERTSEIVRA